MCEYRRVKHVCMSPTADMFAPTYSAIPSKQTINAFINETRASSNLAQARTSMLLLTFDCASRATQRPKRDQLIDLIGQNKCILRIMLCYVCTTQHMENQTIGHCDPSKTHQLRIQSCLLLLWAPVVCVREAENDQPNHISAQACTDKPLLYLI